MCPPSTPTSTPRWPPRSSRSSRTSPTAAGTSRAGSTRWSTPRRSYAASPSSPRRWGSTTRPRPGSLTPVEQEQLPADRFESELASIAWGSEVTGCAAVVERLVLPPDADDAIPDDPAAAAAYASEHPDRQEVRMVVGVTRAGATYCALRLRAHDDDQSVVGGADLVPELITLLGATLEPMDDVEDGQHERAVRRGPAGRARGAPAVPALARAGDHRDRAGARLLRPHDVRELLHQRALVPRHRLRRRSTAGCSGPRSPCSAIFGRADGGRGRGQHGDRVPAAAAVPPAVARAERPRPLPPGRHPDPHLAGASASRVLLGLFAGTSGAGEWRNYMLWRNGVPFERKDAYFGKDIGFFVFDLPWYHFLVDFVMAMTVVALLAAAVVHYLYGGIRLQTPGDRLSGAAQAQLSVLLGVFVLAKAVDYWLDRYDLAYQSGSLLTGITYTDDNAVLPAKAILMGIALICAVLFFLNVWRRTWLLPSMGLALLVLSAILLGLIWPGIVQQFQVKPSEADKEAPYIEKNIAATQSGLRHRHGRGVQAPVRRDDGGRARPRHRPERHLDPAGRPAAGAAGLRAEPAGPRLLLRGRRARRRPLRDQRRRPRAGARRPRARPERAQQRRPELAQPAHRLHPRQRPDRGVRQPARRPATSRSAAAAPATPTRPSGREGNQPGQDALDRGRRRLRDPGLLRREQPRLLRGRQGRPGRLERRARPEQVVDGERRRDDRPATRPRRTTATAASRSARRSASCSTRSSSAAPTSCCPAGSTRTPRSSTTATRRTGCRRSRRG